MRWRSFCDDLLEIIEDLQVNTVVILGALLADTPHTRPVPVTGTAYSTEAAAQFQPRTDPVRGPDRDHPGCCRTSASRPGSRDLVLGRRAALRLAAAEPEGHHGAAAARRGRARRRGAARRAARPGAGVGGVGHRDGAKDDEEISEYVRSLEERGDAEVDISEVIS